MEVRSMVKCCMKKDESRIKEDLNSSNCTELAEVAEQRNQQPQGPVIQWDRFLPLRSLKVLLVENDDSTRQVVSALLCNCSYEVTAVANGLEAWNVLTDPNKQTDLVLTEVVMPYLSGIGLLSKIMNLAPRKNIPVIMMSSDDSMGIVFNCLSKGAVDFLVKPIRKNELKNLWQHVWRKCHSSGGSESENGVGAHKLSNARSIEASDNGTNGSDEDDDWSIDLTAKDGSDDGSGAQSSWSKRVVEVESTKYSWDQLAGAPDSTCDRVIHARLDKISTTEKTGEGDKLDSIAMGKDLEIGFCRNSEKIVEPNLKATSEPRTKSTNNVIVGKTNNTLNGKCSPTLELSLKRPPYFEYTDTSTHKRNVLKQSDLSAFSRYNTTTSNSNQAPAINEGSCSPLDATISSEAAKPVNLQTNSQSNSNAARNQHSNGSSTFPNDMGSSTYNALDSKPYFPGLCEGDKVAQFQVHHHHHHHHVRKVQQQRETANQDDGSSRNMMSSGFTSLAEGNAANLLSASGSNNKSDGETAHSGEKGGSHAAITEGSDNGVAEEGKIGNLRGSGRGVDQERLAHREAALNKFRQKRKERCFEKKVRYQSRKKLAEQRPRVRGQFVRQGG